MTEYEYPLNMTGGHTRAQLLELMHQRLDDARFNHCLRVEQTSRELAEQYDVDVDQAGLAGLLHDYAKQVDPTDFVSVIKQEGLDPQLLDYNRGVWHGMVGVWFIQRELGVSDPAVLQSIRRHTTGDPHMTKLDMVTFLADFIEPARELDVEKKARKVAKTSLVKACLVELQSTLTFLVSKSARIHPLTLATYNALIARDK